mmetsp:Transcript_16946/g.37489  ORF Transcript_16946/g.37489 Transcript_16946/m.37489 type:complete len:104 (-) Transcript_16946:1049-1360(-)
MHLTTFQLQLGLRNSREMMSEGQPALRNCLQAALGAGPPALGGGCSEKTLGATVAVQSPVRSEGTAKAHFAQGLVALMALVALVVPSQGDLDQKKSPSRCRCH